MKSMKWGDLTEEDFKALDKEHSLILLPIGSMEQHGPHLPVSTDSIVVENILQMVFENLPDPMCLLLPTLWCSKSNEHTGFQGTVTLSSNTFGNIIQDICNSVSNSGFKKLVFINYHGGNSDLLVSLARDVHLATGLIIIILEISRVLRTKVPRKFRDLHAGEFETSLLLSLRPDLVNMKNLKGKDKKKSNERMEKLFKDAKYLSPEGGAIVIAWSTKDLTDDGIIGDATLASVESGRQYLNVWVPLLRDALKEISKFNY